MNIYFAATSSVEIEAICDSLCASLDLPPFTFDCHDNWRYAFSKSESLGVNITKADDNCTIEKWVSGCPEGVNFQIRLWCSQEPSRFLPRLKETLKCDVFRYAAATGDWSMIGEWQMLEPDAAYVEALRCRWRFGSVEERQRFVDEIARYVSKLGDLTFCDVDLRAAQQFFTVEDSVALYVLIRDASGRFEEEWREQFLDYFPDSRSSLPKVLA